MKTLTLGIATLCLAVGGSSNLDTSLLYCREQGNCTTLPEYLPAPDDWIEMEKRPGNGLLKPAAALAALIAFSYAYSLARAESAAESARQKLREISSQTELSKAEMIAAEELRQFNNQLTQQAADTYFASLPPQMQAQLMGATYNQTALPAPPETMQNQEQPIEDRKALDMLASAVTSNRSTLLVGATGTGKSVSDAYILTNLIERYPSAEIWVIAQKNDSFNGLDKRGRVSLFDSTDPQLSFSPIDKIWEIYEKRRRAREGERDFKSSPVRLKLADWHSIYQSCKGEKWFPPYLQKLSTLITVGRELNITLLIDTQSFNLSALGLTEDSNIRQNLNILAQGYTWKDEHGNTQGDYGVLSNLLNNRYILPDNEQRARLTEELKELKLKQQPVLFSAIEPPSLALIPDIRSYKKPQIKGKKEEDIRALERIYQLEIDISRGETPGEESETPESAPDASLSIEAKRFTNLSLPYKAAKELVDSMRNGGMNQSEIIEALWGVKPGKSKNYERAVKEYKELL